MKQKILDLIPVIAMALLGILFNTSKDAPEVTFPATPSEANPYFSPDSSEATPEPTDEVELPYESPPVEPTEERKILKLGGVFSAILNKTPTFTALFDQAFESGAGSLWDIHFNKYVGKHSGPLIYYSESAKDDAISLQSEFIEIYEENGWTYGKEFDLRASTKLSLINLGNSRGKPVLITEFGYCDDPNNPISQYIQSEEGQKRIARAYRNAARRLPRKSIMLAAGHHRNGSVGTAGATTSDGYHETEFAFDLIDQIYKLETPKPTGEQAEGYHHLSDVQDTLQSAESVVFGTGSLRAPVDYTPAKKESGWTEIKVSPTPPKAEKSGWKPFQKLKERRQKNRSSSTGGASCAPGQV